MQTIFASLLLAGMTLSLQICGATFTVPGTANPWLAGMPDGSTADGGDSAPAQSPILVTDLLVATDSPFTFSATGLVSKRPDRPFYGPDGGPLTDHRIEAENGIADFTAPHNCLLGVFLDDSQPNLSPAPAAFTFLPAAELVAPSLKQVFFIGDGMTTNSTQQQFITPTGATRLFLGTMDGFEWSNNVGSFTVTVMPVPRLLILEMSSSQARLTWTTNATGYDLETADMLPASVWVTVTNPPAVSGGEYVVDVEVTVQQRYFRLRKP